MQLVTGYTGTKHVSAQDDSIRNVMLGEFNGRGVFPVFNKFEATAVTANEVRVSSGYGINQGRLFKIDRNDYDSCTIENGAAGYKRVDLIVARYLKDEQTGIESCELVVIKGTPNADAYVDPTYTTGNLLTGALQDDMPMYRVKINGVAIEAVERMFEKYESLIGGIDKRIYAMTQEQFNDKLGENQQRFEDWFASVQEYLDGDIAMELTNAVGSHNAALGAFNNNVKDSDGNVSGLGTLPVSHGGTGKSTLAELTKLFYPVGSIYISVNNVNPSTLFGGKWEKIKDRFLLCSGDTYANGATGGEATHVLTASEIPNHTHPISISTSTKYDNANHRHGVQGVIESAGAWSFENRALLNRAGSTYNVSAGTGTRVLETSTSNYKIADNKNTTAQTGTTMVAHDGHSHGFELYATAADAYHNHSLNYTGNTGSHKTAGDTGHNNMPPYLAVNMWKRTA